MYWLAVAFGVAVVLAFLSGAKPIRLVARLQSRWLLVVGLGIQIALEFVGGDGGGLGFGLLMLSYALVLAFCLVNLPVWGMPVLALGVAMNAVVIGLNEGSPTRDRRVETRSGHVERPIERTVKERPESDDDLLGALGQSLRLPDNSVDDAVSPGDIAMALGLVFVLVVGGRRRRLEAYAGEDAAAEVEPFDEEEAALGARRERVAAGPPPIPVQDTDTEATAAALPPPTPRKQQERKPGRARRVAGPERRGSGWRYEPVDDTTPEPEPPSELEARELEQPGAETEAREPEPPEPEPEEPAAAPADDVDAFRAELEALAGDLDDDEKPGRGGA